MQRVILIILSMICLFHLFSCGGRPADIILTNGEIYTMEPDQPWASSIVISKNTIKAVLDKEADIEPFKGPGTRVIDLQGKFVVPGFIDGHVHFNRAGELINDANLMNVATDAGLIEEMTRVVGILEDGEWITGGLWGAYLLWSVGAEMGGGGRRHRWEPDRWLIDEVTRENPCLLYSYDYELFLANTGALTAAGLETETLPGMKVDSRGRPTGLITRGSPALEKIREVVKEKSHDRLLNENRVALNALAEAGIVEIHDIARSEQTARFIELQDNGELTCRVWLRPDLSRGAELKEKQLRMGLHPKTKKSDRWLRYGALKGYIDGIMGTHGALFFEPYDDQPDNYGHYRRHTSDDPEFKIPNMDKMYDLIKIGYDAGFVSNVHAIGTKGVALMLDTYERLMSDLDRDLEGFRIILHSAGSAKHRIYPCV